MRNEIEALLRAVGHFFALYDAYTDGFDVEMARSDMREAAAAVRAELARDPVADGELLPCPFCGDTSRNDDPPVRGMRWFVSCDKCAARTASYETKELAAAAWNRRASLAREPVRHDVASLDRAIREWASSTFPMATIHSHLRHMRKEIDEAEAEPGDVMEWADLLIMTLYGAALGGHSFAELIDATERKHEINVAREWGEPDEHGVVEHVRAVARAARGERT